VRFQDRAQAGRLLAKKLAKYARRENVLVLGIPRGGVPVAFQVAQALHVPLDVFICRKLGVPGQEELALGAVASGGVRVLNDEIIGLLGISPAKIEQIAALQQGELERRERTYRGDRPPLDVRGKIAILIDDGIATGASMLAALTALRRLEPARIVVAVPVAPLSTIERLRQTADEVACVDTPEEFYAIGQFYEGFSQTTDEEVCELLRQAERPAARRVA
jgi:putative phosphoribosyl transferase